jgi:GNAT superfamily N-acetyltransferase
MAARAPEGPDVSETWRFGELEISDDRSRIDLDVVHGYLSRSYWAEGIPRDLVARSIASSLCFGAFERGRQIGFARVVSDCATFAWLADVFVLEEARGRGVSKRLMECVQAHPKLQGLRRFLLATRDAHWLYRKYGFEPLAEPARFMEIVVRNAYRRGKSPG